MHNDIFKHDYNTAGRDGMGDVGLARYEPEAHAQMPDHKGFKLP